MIYDSYYPERTGILLANIDFMVIEELMPLAYAKALLESLTNHDKTHDRENNSPDIMKRLTEYVAKKEKEKQEWKLKNPNRIFNEQLIPVK